MAAEARVLAVLLGAFCVAIYVQADAVDSPRSVRSLHGVNRENKDAENFIDANEKRNAQGIKDTEELEQELLKRKRKESEKKDRPNSNKERKKAKDENNEKEEKKPKRKTQKNNERVKLKKKNERPRDKDKGDKRRKEGRRGDVKESRRRGGKAKEKKKGNQDGKKEEPKGQKRPRKEKQEVEGKGRSSKEGKRKNNDGRGGEKEKDEKNKKGKPRKPQDSNTEGKKKQEGKITVKPKPRKLGGNKPEEDEGKKGVKTNGKKPKKDKLLKKEAKKKRKKQKITAEPNDQTRQLSVTNVRQLIDSQQCGQTFNLNYGESAMLFSVNDRSVLKCKQKFESPEGTTIFLSCLQFSLNSRGCRKEKFLVLPGIDGRKKSKFCSSNSPSLITPSNKLEIRYIRKFFANRDCSGGYICTATVIGDEPTTTPEPTTPKPTTPKPTTPQPTTPQPTTPKPTTTQPTTTQPTTPQPTTPNPTTTQPITTQPTTPKPTPTTPQPTTPKPTTPQSTTSQPTTPQPTTTTNKPTTTTNEPTTTTNKPTTTTNMPTTTTTTNMPTTTTKNMPTTTTTNMPTTTTQPTTTSAPTTNVSATPPVARLFCNDDCGKSTVTLPRIVGGQEASIYEYPWQALLKITSSVFTSPATCGGSIIKKGWVLTAAHCFVNPFTQLLYPQLGLTIVVAEHDINSATETEEIEITPTGNSLFIHPQYKQGNPNSEEHDIALVFLGGTLTFGSGIKPICMPLASDYTPEKEVVVTGWGVTQYQGTQANKLQEVALKLKSQADCKTLNDNAPQTYIISDNMVCALAPNKDACQGDSGGPLVTQSADGRWIQLGVVSFGYECAVENVPGFYTNLANYVDWITDTTQSNQC
ncbi:proteoglycan 4-like [Macrobrachium nipponense]|uniref:proteoglycan 4-like n=1 Tax=Macrobrachium nipponense TaxID=159736 RepID=UPI0030C7DD53